MSGAGGLAGRLTRAWRGLAPERRLAAGAALGLFVTLFLPWYQETVVAAGRSASASVSGWGAFSFVEAAVLLVAAGVLALLFARAEGRRFHLPGGDGGVITAAGAWTVFLVVWRILDKQGAHVSGSGLADTGVEWGIFFALALAALLTVAGSRIRRAGAPEPALGDEDYDFALPARRRPASSAASGASAASADTRVTRARRERPRSPRPVDFPPPEPLADPPTLRFGRTADGEPARDDEQLTIPFDEL